MLAPSSSTRRTASSIATTAALLSEPRIVPAALRTMPSSPTTGSIAASGGTVSVCAQRKIGVPPALARRRNAAVDVPRIAVELLRGSSSSSHSSPSSVRYAHTRSATARSFPDGLGSAQSSRKRSTSGDVSACCTQRILRRTNVRSAADGQPVVARCRAVPGLPALVRGRERRRDRRSRRGRVAARVPRVARRRRDLAQPDPPVAERRLGLRRLRLHGHPSRPRHARRPRPARRRGRGARDPRPARPRPEPLVRPAPVVSRAPRLLRLVGRGPEQLGVDLRRRPGVDVRRRARPLLPPQLRRAAARPRLVEPRGPRGVRADPPVLVRPRHRRLPHRRRARDRQGPGAAGRSGDPRARDAPSLLDVPAGDARRSCARGATLAESYDPPRLLLGEAYSLEVEQWVGYFGADDQLDLAFAFMLTHASLDADEMRGVVAEIEAALPATRGPAGRARTTTSAASRHAGPKATTPARGARS